MGAFWNPNGGIMAGGRSLSKREVSLLKRKWSENHQLPFNPLEGWSGGAAAAFGGFKGHHISSVQPQQNLLGTFWVARRFAF
jgi:hypothetical protein